MNLLIERRETAGEDNRSAGAAYTRHGWGGRAASLPPVHACSTTSAPVERRRCRGVTREKNKVRDGSGESRMKHRLIALCLYTLHHWHFTVPQKFLWLLL